MMGNLLLFVVKFYCSVWFLLGFSVIIYVLIYNWYIPNYSLTESVFFHHDVSCTQLLSLYKIEQNQLQNYNQNNDKFSCQHVHYDIPNKHYVNFFQSGHVYNFELELSMPESSVNRNLGMFMVRLCLFDYDGHQIYDIYRPAILPYTSTILAMAKLVTFIPFYLVNWLSETHIIKVKLLDENADVANLNFGHINKIRLEIETLKPIEINPPSKLFIHVDLKGISYFMYWWPLTTFLLVVGGMFSIFLSLYLCSLLRGSYKRAKTLSDYDDGTTQNMIDNGHDDDDEVGNGPFFDADIFDEEVNEPTTTTSSISSSLIPE